MRRILFTALAMTGACGPANDLTEADTTVAFQALLSELGGRYVDATDGRGTFEREVPCSGGGTVAFVSRIGSDPTETALDEALALIQGDPMGVEAEMDDCSDGVFTFNGDIEIEQASSLLDPTDGDVVIEGAVWFESAAIEGSCDVDIELSYAFSLADFDPSEVSAIFEQGWDAPLPFDLNLGADGEVQVEVCGHEDTALAVGIGERVVAMVFQGVVAALEEVF